MAPDYRIQGDKFSAIPAALCLDTTTNAILAALPFTLLLLVAGLSFSYRYIRTVPLGPRYLNRWITLHAFATEGIQLLLLILALVGILRFNHAIVCLARYQRVNVPASWTLGLLGSTAIAVLHWLAVYAVDLVEGRVMLGRWRHPYGGYVFVVTRCKLGGLKQVWKQPQTRRPREERPRQWECRREEAKTAMRPRRRASVPFTHATRVEKTRKGWVDRRVRHRCRGLVLQQDLEMGGEIGRERRHSSPTLVAPALGRVAAAVGRLERLRRGFGDDKGGEEVGGGNGGPLPSPPDSTTEMTSPTSGDGVEEGKK